MDEWRGRGGKDSNHTYNCGNVLQSKDTGGQFLFLSQHTWQEREDISHHDDRQPTHCSNTGNAGTCWKYVASGPFVPVSRSLEAQLEALIVKPLELAKSQADIVDSHPKLIILDSLDECGGPGSHQSVLQVILAAFKRHNLPFSFLVVSRPEQKIPSTNTPWVCLLSGWCLTTSTSRMKIFELSWCRCFTTSNEGTHLAPAFPLGLLKKTSNDWSKSHRASSFMHRLS